MFFAGPFIREEKEKENKKKYGAHPTPNILQYKLNKL